MTSACPTTIHQLDPQHLPQQPLYNTGDGVGWQLASTPFTLDADICKQFKQLGPVLYQWQQASQTLYNDSLKNKKHPWLAKLLNQGKPDDLLRFAQMKRFKKMVPLVLRPDILLTEDGIKMTELDWVPGGIGFTSAMNKAYRHSGFEVQESDKTMPLAFLQMLKNQIPNVDTPTIAIVVGGDFMDYWLEMQWLVNTIKPDYPHIHLVHPKAIDWQDGRLVFEDDDKNQHPIDLVYRFFEHYDLLNIPKIELIQYAAKKGAVHVTPPFKPVFEEKMWMALLHHPALKTDWQALMGKDNFEFLSGIVPATWILDPTPLPPQAIIPDLTVSGEPVQDFSALKGLSQKERQKVVKVSGYSPSGWGSKSVVIGHDVSGEDWDAAIDYALSQFEKNPYIMQIYHKPKAVDVQRFDISSKTSTPFKGRIRLCPYYFVMDSVLQAENGKTPTIEWAGTLATICPADKKIIHGMKDAMMTACQKAD